MSVTIIESPPGACGYSLDVIDRVIKSVSGPDYSGVLWLAPSVVLLEERARLFNLKAGRSIIPPEFVTPSQFSKRLVSLYGRNPVLEDKVVPLVISCAEKDGIGLSSIISKFSADMIKAYPGMTFAEMQRFVSDLLDEMFIPDVVKKRVLLSIKTSGKLKELIAKEGFIRGSETVYHASHIVKNNIQKRLLVVDYFHWLDNDEKILLESLVMKSDDTIIILPASDFTKDFELRMVEQICRDSSVAVERVEPTLKDEHVYYYPFASIEGEVEGIARYIKSALISGRVKDPDGVLVAFPNVESRRELVERIFVRYGIPFSYVSQVSLSSQRPFQDIMRLLEAVWDDYPRLEFTGFLASQFFKGMPEEIFAIAPKVSVISGVSKGKGQWLRFFKKFAEDENKQAIYQGILKVFRRLERLESLRIASYGEFVDALSDVLRLFEFSYEDEEGKTTREIFRPLATVELLAGRNVTLRDFIDAVRHIFDSTSVDRTQGGVRIMSIKDCMGMEPDLLCIAGLQDGEIPALPPMDYILPDIVKARLGFMTMKDYLKEEEFRFEIVRRSAKEVFLSYPCRDDDKIFLPSVFIAGFEERSQRTAGVFTKEEELIREGLHLPVPAIEEVEGIKRKADGEISVTDIDGYRSCPRKFFIESVLKLEPIELAEFRPEARELGNVAHKIMEKLIATPVGTEAEFTRLAGIVSDDVLNSTSMDKYWADLFKESFLKIIPDIYEIECKIQMSGFKFHDAEKKIIGEPLMGVRLKGKADRIDARDGGDCEIIDYKSGSAIFSSKDILEKGASLQLLLYAALLKAEGLHTTRVGLYSLKDLKVSWIPNSRNDKKEGRTLDDYIIVALKYLEETVDALRHGDYKAVPMSEGAGCRYCHERPYCPYIRGSGETDGT